MTSKCILCIFKRWKIKEEPNQKLGFCLMEENSFAGQLWLINASIYLTSIPTALKFRPEVLRFEEFFFPICLCMLGFLPLMDFQVSEFWSASEVCRPNINKQTKNFSKIFRYHCQLFPLIISGVFICFHCCMKPIA